MRHLVPSAVHSVVICGALLLVGCDSDSSSGTSDVPAKASAKKSSHSPGAQSAKNGASGKKSAAAKSTTGQLPGYDGMFASDPQLSATRVATWTDTQLRIRRNEIYARYGRAFKSADLQAHFGKQPWYQVRADYSDAVLTDHDRANATLIQGFEGKAKVWDGQVGELMFMDRSSLVISDADSMYGHEGEERHYVARGSKYVVTWSGPAKFDLQSGRANDAELWTWTGRKWTRAGLAVPRG